MRKLKSPLGRRDEWEKPTVLLGSAGLNLAVAWKLKGGSGCTCMDPMAYDLREHRIFDTPFKIDRDKLISIPTPADFKSEIKEPEIMVLPLVADQGRQWSAGLVHSRERFRGVSGCRIPLPAESIIRPRRRQDCGDRGTCCTLVLNSLRPK